MWTVRRHTSAGSAAQLRLLMSLSSSSIFFLFLHLNLFDHFYGFMDESAMGGIRRFKRLRQYNHGGPGSFFGVVSGSPNRFERDAN